MFKENYYETISNFVKKSDFGEPRNYGYDTFHAAIDYISKRFKRQNIYTLIAGVVIDFGQSKYAGNFVKLKHNFKFIGGVDEVFYSEYKHLDFILPIVQDNVFLPAGSEIGNMGNTGYSKTFDKRKWRLLTKEEKKDPKCNKAVHIHIEFSQEEKTFSTLIMELMKLNLIKTKFDGQSANEYFYRKNKLYINPKIIMDYAKILLEEQNV